jgi:hypothetical protein
MRTRTYNQPAADDTKTGHQRRCQSRRSYIQPLESREEKFGKATVAYGRGPPLCQTPDKSNQTNKAATDCLPKPGQSGSYFCLVLAKQGLDPNVWIDNVEMLATARIGTETVTYVANIYKHYIAYKLIALQENDKKKTWSPWGTGPNLSASPPSHALTQRPQKGAPNR